MSIIQNFQPRFPSYALTNIHTTTHRISTLIEGKEQSHSCRSGVRAHALATDDCILPSGKIILTR